MTFDMKFEEWWHKHDYDIHYGENTKKITQAAWNAAIVEERERCREIALDTARIVRESPSLLGTGVAEAVAQRIDK